MPQKQDLLGKLSEKKKQIQISLKPHGKKAPAPKPPPRLDDCTPPNGVSPCFDLRPVISQQHICEERESSPSPTKPNNNVPQGKHLQTNYVHETNYMHNSCLFFKLIILNNES